MRAPCSLQHDAQNPTLQLQITITLPQCRAGQNTPKSAVIVTQELPRTAWAAEYINMYCEGPDSGKEW